MERFPEQLLNARKAAGMTQEQLADAVHVARNTISSWEHGRTQPDLETLRLLGQVLHFDFMNDAPIRKEIQTAGQFTASPPPEIPAGIAPVNQLQKKRILAIVALAVIILIVSLIVIPKRSGTPSAYKDDSGKVYTVADYKAVTPNQPGKAYLSITTTLEKQPTGNGGNFLYAFIMKEENGIGFSIERMEHINFFYSGNSVSIDTFTADDVRTFLHGSPYPVSIMTVQCLQAYADYRRLRHTGTFWHKALPLPADQEEGVL